MGKIFKVGRVVILTAGRYAGRKAIVVKSYDDSSVKSHKFPNLLLLGLSRHPERVKRQINKKKLLKKTGVKTFIKRVNQIHVIPTRYLISDLDLKDITSDVVSKIPDRTALRREWNKKLSTKYRNQPDPKTNEKASHIKFFFSKLRF